jgi:hypothetical protein
MTKACLKVQRFTNRYTSDRPKTPVFDFFSTAFEDSLRNWCAMSAPNSSWGIGWVSTPPTSFALCETTRNETSRNVLKRRWGVSAQSFEMQGFVGNTRSQLRRGAATFQSPV